MATLFQYKLDDGSDVFIEVEEEQESGVVRTARNTKGNIIVKVERKFSEAFDQIKSSAAILRQKLDDLKADEVEVKFGLKASSELGSFIVAKTGLEANYEVTLKWSNKK